MIGVHTGITIDIAEHTSFGTERCKRSHIIRAGTGRLLSEREFSEKYGKSK